MESPAYFKVLVVFFTFISAHPCAPVVPNSLPLRPGGKGLPGLLLLRARRVHLQVLHRRGNRFRTGMRRLTRVSSRATIHARGKAARKNRYRRGRHHIDTNSARSIPFRREW